MLDCLAIADAAGLSPAKRSGRETLFRCPCHEDHHPSLSVNPQKNCFFCGPCDKSGGAWAFAAFLSGLNPSDKKGISAWLKDKGLSETNGNKNTQGERKVVASYPYRDALGNLVFEVVRYEPKDFRQRRPDGSGGWIYNRDGVDPVLYRLPELLVANPREVVFIPEGEKDVDALGACGLIATCNPGGAGKWQDGYSEPLRDRDVVVLPDKDDAGRRHAQKVGTSLLGIAHSLKILELPGLQDKGDVRDWLINGGTREQLLELVSKTPETKPEKKYDGSPQWPESLPSEAFHGLAGEIIRILEPHTEADPAVQLI